MPVTYDDETRYRVTLTRPVKLGSVKLLPRDRHRILGDALNQIVATEGADAIGSAEPIGPTTGSGA